MKKRGFTLIELLAVIVILAIIAIIATPIITDVIETAREGSAEASALGYFDSIEKAIVLSEISGENTIESGTYSVGELESKIDYKGEGPSIGTVVIKTDRSIDSAILCVDDYKVIYSGENASTNLEKGCSDMSAPVAYEDAILNGADPVIGTDMIPVTIAGDGAVTYADTFNEWYNYANKEWANAVLLKDSSSASYSVGDKILEGDIESYFVWIPRYRYKLFNLGNYISVTTATPGASNAQTINIEFETKEDVTSSGTTIDSWLTHPAFTSLNVNGIWVGKYETSYFGATSKAAAEVLSSDSSKILIKPNQHSWRNNSLYNIFVSNYNYSRDNDSHMIKNTEWGAIVYLSRSIYGINSEINSNNNSEYLTGYSSTASANQSTYPGTSGNTSELTQPYNTVDGYKASTTGNITGVYDMSGGSWEAMASHVDGNLGNSGFAVDTIDDYEPKYFDLYSASSAVTSYNYRILGDATGELGAFYSYADGDSVARYHNNWYSDHAYFIDSTHPWFKRGGDCTTGILTGQFNFAKYNGNGYSNLSSRIVLAN